MKRLCIVLLLVFPILSCVPPDNPKVKDIPTPPGYKRIIYNENSFPRWLRQLPIKSGTDIIAFDGTTVSAHSFNLLAVVAKPLLFHTDLEQCADFCMRFWAEYFRDSGQSDLLYLFDYKGQRKYFTESTMDFTAFLRTAMSFTNPHSLQRGSQCVENTPEPGNFFIQADNPSKGHTSLILDACRNSKGDRLYLIGFGYMPAQEFHIEKAYPDYGKAGWFSLKGYKQYLRDFYSDYGEIHLRRF
ncbi:MAG: hypothetical protein JXJ04_15235 [Spirochaetales bacterium]|nr:hypothetical protein [Spirochaetales bacterium]